jgi:hypothetical protein
VCVHVCVCGGGEKRGNTTIRNCRDRTVVRSEGLVGSIKAVCCGVGWWMCLTRARLRVRVDHGGNVARRRLRRQQEGVVRRGACKGQGLRLQQRPAGGGGTQSERRRQQQWK